MAIKTLDQIDVASKTVLIRVDYNVPYDDNMQITDDTRIRATLPTLQYCLTRGSRIILISHMGRPKGKIVPSMSLRPVAAKLSEITRRDVQFIDTPIGDELKKKVQSMKDGDIFLLENIRFYPGEEKNDDEFGRDLASLADVYINDAFAAAHNKHASNVSVTKYVNDCGAGFLLNNEIAYFNKAMMQTVHPLGAIIGGAKVSSKLDALNNIMNRVDFIIIGGGMAFTFLKAMGYNVGKSILEEELVETARNILEKAQKSNLQILLPVDIVDSREFRNDAPSKIVSIDGIQDDQMGLDIGPDSIKLFSEKIKTAKTIIWNGPMGAFELPGFSRGTNAIAELLASTRHCLSIVGGGDSVTAVNQAGVADKISYLSTGGGAFLKLLEGKTLPAIAALDR
jgi:phosphoglycerate kinase